MSERPAWKALYENQPSAAFLFLSFSALRPPNAAAAPAPNKSTPPGAGTGVPPELELDVDVEVEVEVEVDVVVEPPVEVDVLDDELLDDLLDLEDLLLFELLLDLQKMKHLFDFDLLNQLVALASLGVAATTPVVASDTPMTAACVILMYCIVSSPSL